MSQELDPEAAAMLDTIAKLGRPPTYALSVESARTALDDYFAGQEVERELPHVDEFTIPGPSEPIPVRHYRPDAPAPHPLLVYFHGGGFVTGGLDSHDNVCRALAHRADCAVLSVDYRLAPEDPFPAAVNDAYAAVEWAAEHGGEVSADPSRIAVGGDSAGGNLAAVTALRAQDEGGPDLVHQSLVYPTVASPLHEDEFDSIEENAEGYFLERETMDWFHERYVQDPVHLRNAYRAPLLASDLSGLPPATVLTAGFDPLRDEGRAYADRLDDAGVAVRREHFPGMIHGFVSMTRELSTAQDGLDAVAAGLVDAFE